MFTATVKVTGAHRSDFQSVFFTEEMEVTSDTIGGVFDEMVEASYSIYFQLITYLADKFPSDYNMEDDYWYVVVSHPSVLNPYNYEAGTSAGSSLSNTGALVETVTHYRHLELGHFFTGDIKYLKDGEFLKYVEGFKPERNFYDIFETRDVPEFRNYGFTGTQLNLAIAGMGDDYYRFLEETGHFRSLLARGTLLEVIIPNKDGIIEPPSLGKRLLRLFRR